MFTPVSWDLKPIQKAAEWKGVWNPALNGVSRKNGIINEFEIFYKKLWSSEV